MPRGPGRAILRPMERHVLPLDRIHPAAQEKVAQNRRSTVEEAIAAVDKHEWVILGMAQNPIVKKARQALKDAGHTHHYIAYGSYLKEWRKRNAFKMWTGWPTFPMVFHKGVLVGGSAELKEYLASKD
jgi:monothiol glutaredoxin